MRLARCFSLLGFLAAAATFFGSAACSECTAADCDFGLKLTLKNAQAMFASTPTPTVVACAGSVCTTFLVDGTDPANVKCDAADGAPDPYSGCSVSAEGVGNFVAAGTDEEGDITVSVEVRAPAGDVLLSVKQTVTNEDASFCGGECHEAHPTLTLP